MTGTQETVRGQWTYTARSMSTNQRQPGRSTLFVLLWLLAFTGVALAIASQSLPPRVCTHLFSETGAFEQASPWLWLALAGFVVVFLRRFDAVVLSSVFVCAACASREWDLHKSITGYSVLKPKFYLSSEFPLQQQLIAGTVVATLGISVAILIRHAIRVWPRGRQPVPPWMWAMFIGGILLVLTKILDRNPSILLDMFGIVQSPAVLSFYKAWEEGFEVMIPIPFAVMVVTYRMAAQRPKPTETGIDSAS